MTTKIIIVKDCKSCPWSRENARRKLWCKKVICRNDVIFLTSDLTIYQEAKTFSFPDWCPLTSVEDIKVDDLFEVPLDTLLLAI